MATTERRRKWVQTLRRGAREHDLPRVPDNAAKEKVKEMAEKLLECEDLAGEDRAAMEDAWSNYKGSWPEWVETGGDEPEGQAERQTQGAAPKQKSWYFSAAQLTYNCTTGDWASSDALVLHALFDRCKAFFLTCLHDYKPLGVSATMERSTATDTHVHVHCYFHLPEPFRAEGPNSLQPFVFDSIRPHVQPNTARGDAYKPAVNRGHYYVEIDKIGSLYSWTNYPPYQSYGPEAWWIDGWYKQGKLASDVYLGEAARIGVGFQRRLGDIRAAERYLREAAVDAHIRAEQAALRGQLGQFRMYEEVEAFIALFAPGTSLHRRPMLALIGGTNLGKSMLAANVLERVATVLGVSSFLEVTVEGNEHLDLNGFDHRAHSGVLLDGVGDAFFLRQHREVLQGRAKKCTGGQSATNVYAYPFTLARRAVIATFDLSAKNLQAFAHHHWLSDKRNVVVLKLGAPAYQTPPATAGSRARPETRGSPSHPAHKRSRPVGSPSSSVPALPPLPPLPR